MCRLIYESSMGFMGVLGLITGAVCLICLGHHFPNLLPLLYLPFEIYANLFRKKPYEINDCNFSSFQPAFWGPVIPLRLHSPKWLITFHFLWLLLSFCFFVFFFFCLISVQNLYNGSEYTARLDQNGGMLGLSFVKVCLKEHINITKLKKCGGGFCPSPLYFLFKTKLLPIYAGREHISIVYSVGRSWNV